MDDDTPTEAATPTPAEVVEAPTTEAPAIAETPAEEPKTEAEPVEEPKPEAVPWAEVTDPYELLDLPDLQIHLERRDRGVEERLQTDYRQRYEVATKSWESQQVHKQMAGFYGNILQKIEDGDAETVGKLIDRLEKAVEPYAEPYRQSLKDEGAAGVGTHFLVALRNSLPRRGQDELMDYITTHRSAPWETIVKERDRLREDGSRKPLEDEITSLKAANEELKRRATTGPDLTKPAGGAKGDDNERLLDPETPVAELREIRERQKAGA